MLESVPFIQSLAVKVPVHSFWIVLTPGVYRAPSGLCSDATFMLRCPNYPTESCGLVLCYFSL